jgi:DNA adenine methylase
LYGKGGELHTRFSHSVFAQTVRVCPHRWLITYDDSPEIRRLFTFARLYTWEFQYGMNNYKQKTAEKGQELFLVNYGVSCPPGIQTTLLLDEE